MLDCYEKLSGRIIGFAIDIHRELGPGLFEKVYQQCLAYELSAAKINFCLEEECPIIYKGIQIANAYRIDMLVDDKIIVELKSVERLSPLHEAQILTYMRLKQKTVGLLINFNEKLLKDGIKRFVLKN